MNIEDVQRKVHNLETLAAQPTLSPSQRSVLSDEVRQVLDELQVERAMKNWAAGGAAAGAVLPVLGLISGGAAGALYGAYKMNRPEIVDARERLQRLLVQLA